MQQVKKKSGQVMSWGKWTENVGEEKDNVLLRFKARVQSPLHWWKY